MLKIVRNGIKPSIATPFSSKFADSCSLTRSVSSQISVQKSWPWPQQTVAAQSTAMPLPLCLRHGRWYSSDSGGESPDDQQIPDTKRKIPKISNESLLFGALPFSFFILNYKAWQIQKYDSEFSLNEFVEGSKKAVEVCFLKRSSVFPTISLLLLANGALFRLQIVTDKLALCDFDALRGMVTDEVIDDLREKLPTWTNDQRSYLRTESEDMCRAILHSIETVESDDRLLVKMSMVYHVVEGFQQLTKGTLDYKLGGKFSAQDLLRKSSE